MIYSLIHTPNTKGKGEWDLVEGYSRYTPYTTYYEIDPTNLEKYLNVFKRMMIYSTIKGRILKTLEIKQALKTKDTKTIL